MNELNYASLEASKRLYDAGIVLETDAVWAQRIYLDPPDWVLISKDTREYNRKWRAANPDSARLSAKKWAAGNKEKRDAYSKVWRARQKSP